MFSLMPYCTASSLGSTTKPDWGQVEIVRNIILCCSAIAISAIWFVCVQLRSLGFCVVLTLPLYPGWMSDRSWADCLMINNVALIVGGIATILCPFCNTYVLLAMYASVFGLCIGEHLHSLISFLSLR